ncbi:hypothetical protein L249_2309 [Ophiocordyceps polyrhachis-furcata BCC 54312]|uniref:Uncharacterized protein n=1 Tax=Ophiocordyceps polyrhachis-furcata BCC 54312 TaxID=1330021 RepID=A0A367LRA6_9HYPO|nr:hypothetical protein L249_2309 [Ophiocordyceps polyrhachis-furcata BCC 54312]
MASEMSSSLIFSEPFTCPLPTLILAPLRIIGIEAPSPKARSSSEDQYVDDTSKWTDASIECSSVSVSVCYTYSVKTKIEGTERRKRMHLIGAPSPLLLPLFLTLTTAADVDFSCTMGDKRCVWYGNGPVCGSSHHEIGYVDKSGLEYVRSTRFNGPQTLSQRDRNADSNWLSRSCADSYGLHCVTGYKRLYCESQHNRTALMCQCD